MNANSINFYMSLPEFSKEKLNKKTKPEICFPYLGSRDIFCIPKTCCMNLMSPH
jgi:hypothetical protein